MTASKPNWIGHSLSGRYRIDTLLGQGGMSAVYKAYDPNLRRTVAVKLIHSHLANDPLFVQRFEQEAGAVAALRHPNIVGVYDFDHDGDTYYMVMEYVEGQSLQQRLRALHQRGQRLPQTETLDLLATISAAVGFAHQQGLIHRDLKPANIMLNAAGQPILMDFGVVKIVGGQIHTATGVVVGTPLYVAPELIRGRKPDARSDLYSLGIMLFEMLTGHPPFDADSAMALMIKHVNEPVPDIRGLQPDISPALARTVELALAKDPEQRFQSANDFANALRSVHLGPPPRPTGATPPPRLGSRDEPPPPAAPQPAAGGRRLALLGCGGLLALGLLVATVAAAFALNATLNRPGPTDTAPAATTSAALTATQAPLTAAPTTAAPPTPTEAAATATSAAPSATAAPPTRTLAPLFTATLPPPSATEPAPPTPTAPVTPTQALAAHITGISLAGDRYAVSFSTTGYVAMLPGQHVHFFFDTVPPEQAGSPASGPWIVHAAQPNPFTGYGVADRPSGASQMCILVANPNHSVIANSGNCWPLP